MADPLLPKHLGRLRRASEESRIVLAKPVYGRSTIPDSRAATSFAALQSAGVLTFCDIRRQRGVRGHEYAFANVGRLQERLAELGIAYMHRLDLAPERRPRVRTSFSNARANSHPGEGRRRTPNRFDPHALMTDLPDDWPVVIFCVERDPRACHRGLVAARLVAAGATITHLTP